MEFGDSRAKAQGLESPNMRKKNKYAFLGSDPLGALLRGTAEEWDDAKHPRKNALEVSMINSISVRECPFCGSEEIKRNGKKPSGVGTYLCKSCCKRFDPLTGTVFAGAKIPISERMEFALHLLEDHSLITSTTDNMNASTTGFLWLAQIFDAIDGCQDGSMLSGEVWMDEFYIPLNSDRRARRSDGKLRRGLSSDQVCVASATDGRHHVFKACGLGNASAAMISGALSRHIAHGSTLHHDGSASHSKIVNELGLKSVVHPTSETTGLPDRKNPMRPINELHALLSHYLYNHYGFRRERTQSWLNLFWVKTTQCERSKLDGAKYIIYRMLTTKKSKTYREFYSMSKVSEYSLIQNEDDIE